MTLMHTTFHVCKKTDKNGQILIEEMNRMNLEIVNDKMRTHIGEINQNDSNLDLVFASNDLVASINCSQGDDPWGSDYYPVKISVQQDYVPYFKKSNKISSKKTDWKKYEMIMKEKEKLLNDNEYTVQSYENKYNFIYNNMIDAVKEACKEEEECEDEKTVRLNKRDKREKDREDEETHSNFNGGENRCSFETKKPLCRVNRKGKSLGSKKIKSRRPVVRR